MRKLTCLSEVNARLTASLGDTEAYAARLRGALREIEALHWFRNPYTSGYQNAFEQAKGIARTVLSEPLDKEEG